MGLNIRVNVPVDNLPQLIDEAVLEKMISADTAKYAQKLLEEKYLQEIGIYQPLLVRVGSYKCLQALRVAYIAMVENISVDSLTGENRISAYGRHCLSNLIHHSDYGGWYLPENIQPVFVMDISPPHALAIHVSIGSSFGLLSELESMIGRDDVLVGAVKETFDELFICAVASIASMEPMKFC